MKEIKAFIQPFMLHHVLDALHQIEGVPAVTVFEVRGVSLKRREYAQIVHSRLEIMVADELVEAVVQAIQTHAHTGKSGDGHIFVTPIETTVAIRTGKRGGGEDDFILPVTTQED